MKPQTSVPQFPKLEEETLAFWRTRKIFEKTLAQTKKGKRFVFFEGPPTANGKPGIHHIEARAFKDIIPRFKTMQGYHVERKAGWDTHGLPVELEVEKSLGLKNKKDIEAYGIDKFNAACRESVWKYKDEWEKMTERIGFWLDLENPYVTYDPKYVESLWAVIKQIWDKDLLYQSHRVAPYCPRCGTVISSHEMAQGYQDVTEESVYVKFELVDEAGTFVLAWTTTPWTLPGNVALAVSPKITYVVTDKGYILAKERVAALEALGIELGAVKSEMKGSELVGKKYKPLFDIKAFHENEKSYTILPADFVTTEDGTGVVHTAVMYGEDDYQLGVKEGLPQHHTVTETGVFTDEVPLVAGKWFKKAEAPIKDDLEQRGLLLKRENFTHSYPHCWRCDTPLMYYARQSWYIRMSSLRDQLLKANETINWIPGHIKDGRFGEWLREVKDWAFSRERYWGTPLPIWVCEENKEHTVCVGGFDELATMATKKLPKDFDPHRPGVDTIELKCPECSGTMRRVKELCDVWFDSGAMPYAQWHYPFENKEKIEKGEAFPADYISEAIDQTRGWFYTLLAVSTLLGKEAPYKNVICLGHILDAKGQKMSKHVGNVIAPNEVIDQYGADAIRWFMYTINQPGDSKNFDEKILQDMVKKHFMILANVVSFYKLFAKGDVEPKIGTHIMDRWIGALTSATVATMTQRLEQYDVTGAARAVTDLITEVSTWYVRRSRDRFKGDSAAEAIATLKYVLITIAKLSAPFTPFTAERVYQDVGGDKESVHLDAWPTTTYADEKVLNAMQSVRSIVELTHRLRAEAGIKVRQPLPQVVFKGTELDRDLAAVLAQEINVMEVHQAEELPTGKEWQSAKEATIGVALDTTVTDELLELGYVREISRTVNALRKKAKLTPDDMIELHYASDNKLAAMLFERHGNTLKKETRASAISEGKGKHAAELQLGDIELTLSFD